MSDEQEIPSPLFDSMQQQYQTDCKDAAQPFLDALARRFIEAGWDRRAVYYAFMALAARTLAGESKHRGAARINGVKVDRSA